MPGWVFAGLCRCFSRWGRGVLPVVAAAFLAGAGFCPSLLCPVPGRHSGGQPPALRAVLCCAPGFSCICLLLRPGLLSYPYSSPAPSFARLSRAPGRPCCVRLPPPVACFRHPLPARASTCPGVSLPRPVPCPASGSPRRVLPPPAAPPRCAVSRLPPPPLRRVLLGGAMGITSDFYRKTTIFCCFSNFYLYICIAETKRHGIWTFTLRPTNSQPFKIKSSPGSLAAGALTLPRSRILS